MDRKDYYHILGMDKNATEEEIKKAYRQLALMHHPDRNHGDKEAEERFKEIAEAYAVLSDREKRMEYDHFGYTKFRQRYRPEDIFDGFNANYPFSLFSCGRGGWGCGRRKAKFFGGRLFRDTDFWEKGINHGVTTPVYNLSLSPSEAASGIEKEFLLRRRWGTKKILVKIPPMTENDTLLQVSVKGNYMEVKDDFYLRVKIIGSK
ncbi:MAG: DnaJ domain-containing protein [Thermodesulfobacteriota bacterium]|nr:DnaJ domain-containing protein [Thermodesulfobacteriota bacterium]